MILAGDIGGTKTNLALFDESLKMKAGSQRKYASGKHASLEEVLEKYRSEVKAEITAAGFGVAGPVKGREVKATNLPWDVRADSVGKLLRVEKVALANDLVANAAGIDVLPEGSLETICPGTQDPAGNRAIISAGTGLGQGSMIHDPRRGKHVPVPSEGGHADFAPRSEIEVELWRYLTANFGRAEWEHVLSGPGFFNIYRFLRDVKKMEEPAWLREEIEKGDKSAAVSVAAMNNRAEIAVKTMDLFVGFYGAQAGNAALGVVATGGVYLGGGIAPKILPKLKSPRFIEAFVSKGPMRRLMEGIPVQVILNPDTALYGAAALARE
jgi:glucokinase